MARQLKAKDIEKLENTSVAAASGIGADLCIGVCATEDTTVNLPALTLVYAY